MISDHIDRLLKQYNNKEITSLQLSARISNLLSGLQKWELEIKSIITKNRDLMSALNGSIPSFSRSVRKSPGSCCGGR